MCAHHWKRTEKKGKATAASGEMLSGLLLGFDRHYVGFFHEYVEGVGCDECEWAGAGADAQTLPLHYSESVSFKM